MRLGKTALILESSYLSLVARTPRTERVSPTALKCTERADLVWRVHNVSMTDIEVHICDYFLA